jgi:hypothetical protein
VSFAALGHTRLPLVAATILMLAWVGSGTSQAALTEESFGQKTEGKPSLSTSGEVLTWSASDPTGAYLLRRTLPLGEPEYALVKSLRARPPTIAGATVGYRVKGLLESNWSPEASITYDPLALDQLGGLTEASFFTTNQDRASLSVSGEALNWSEAEPSGAYLLKRIVAGGTPEYAFVKGTHVRPPAVAGKTVGYRVKGILETYWSPEVSIDYQYEEEGPPGTGTTVNVNAAPTGPATPVGGWHVAFADGFGAPLGTEPGQDNFVYPNQNTCCDPFEDRHGNNTNELEVFNGSQVRVGGEGLELIDKYSPKRAPAEGAYPVRNYLSGSISTQAQYAAGGWRPFTWKPGEGETWAFECNCKLPVNSPLSGVDPGWWSSDVTWTNEIDFFEEWGWGAGCGSSLLTACYTGVAWLYKTYPIETIESYKDLYSMFDPSAGFHRYTTVIYPNNTLSEYIDGVLQRWVGVNGVAPAPPSFTKPRMSLLLTNAIRDQRGMTGPNPYPGFSSGTRTFTARSIAVYEDGAHAGQHVTGGGVAPGTAIR